MEIKFLLIQILGIIAWVFLILSYHRKDTNKIIIFQIVGNILYCIHYLLLGAYGGLFICFFEIIFDYGYYKTTKDDLIYLISIPVRIFGGLISLISLIDILPIIASLIDGYSLTKKKRFVVIGAIISYSIWFIYDFSVLSYSGALADLVIIISNLSILLFNFNIFKFLYYEKQKVKKKSC